MGRRDWQPPAPPQPRSAIPSPAPLPPWANLATPPHLASIHEMRFPTEAGTVCIFSVVWADSAGGVFQEQEQESDPEERWRTMELQSFIIQYSFISLSFPNHSALTIKSNVWKWTKYYISKLNFLILQWMQL